MPPRPWSSFSTAVGSAAATSRACRRGFWPDAWRPGSRSPRQIIGCRKTPHSRPRCSMVRVRSSTCERTHKELGIDPARIAASGSSAGAGIALWIAFHDDLADPQSPDPVARQSSRLTCVGVDGAQTSYDPRFIKALIGGRAHEHPALPLFYGISSDADGDSARVHKLYEEASPINYVSTGDPPAILFYAEPNGPLPADAKPGQGIHHPRFGEALKAQLDPLKIECILHHSSEYPNDTDPIDGMCRDMTEFFVRKLRSK